MWNNRLLFEQWNLSPTESVLLAVRHRWSHQKNRLKKCSSTIFTHVPLLLSRARRSQAEPRGARTVSRRRSTAQQLVPRKCARCAPAVDRPRWPLRCAAISSTCNHHRPSPRRWDCPSRLTVWLILFKRKSVLRGPPIVTAVISTGFRMRVFACPGRGDVWVWFGVRLLCRDKFATPSWNLLALVWRPHALWSQFVIGGDQTCSFSINVF